MKQTNKKDKKLLSPIGLSGLALVRPKPITEPIHPGDPPAEPKLTETLMKEFHLIDFNETMSYSNSIKICIPLEEVLNSIPKDFQPYNKLKLVISTSNDSYDGSSYLNDFCIICPHESPIKKSLYKKLMQDYNNDKKDYENKLAIFNEELVSYKARYEQYERELKEFEIQMLIANKKDAEALIKNVNLELKKNEKDI